LLCQPQLAGAGHATTPCCLSIGFTTAADVCFDYCQSALLFLFNWLCRVHALYERLDVSSQV
jgi:hypothetical protein